MVLLFDGWDVKWCVGFVWWFDCDDFVIMCFVLFMCVVFKGV